MSSLLLSLSRTSSSYSILGVVFLPQRIIIVLIEKFSSPTAGECYVLELSNSGLTSRHAYHLILLLTQARHLKELNLSSNPGLHGGAIPFLLSTLGSQCV